MTGRRLSRSLSTGLLALAACLVAGPAAAVDHNNLDAHRPLTFEDADSLAYREQALEAGLRLAWPRRRPLGLELSTEYLYGILPDSHLVVGLQPSFGGRAGSRDTRPDPGDVSLGFFHNFRREHGPHPALALRADVAAPTGHGSRGAAFRLRGIASRQAGRYGRFHVNADLQARAGAPGALRAFHPALALGYSHPLGYPTHFATTALAELVVRAGEHRGAGAGLAAGLGVRRQVGLRSVFDAGIQADLAGGRRVNRDRLRLIAGYSYSF